MEGIAPNMVIGASTEVHVGAGLIATAGGIDTHIHLSAHNKLIMLYSVALPSMIGGGTKPADGTSATIVTNERITIGAAVFFILIAISMIFMICERRRQLIIF